MSRVARKPDFCICENKDADQLRGNREDDQRLCFRYKDSRIPRLPKSEVSSLYPSSVTVQPGLCRTWSETPKTGFLRMRLIFLLGSHVSWHLTVKSLCYIYNSKHMNLSNCQVKNNNYLTKLVKAFKANKCTLLVNIHNEL